jgi:hypothetical protein
MSYRPETYLRVFVGVIGFLGVFFAPPWVPVIAMILLSLRYPAPEVLFIGLLMDFLWMPGNTAFPIPIFTLLGITLVWIASPLRKQFLL